MKIKIIISLILFIFSFLIFTPQKTNAADLGVYMYSDNGLKLWWVVGVYVLPNYNALTGNHGPRSDAYYWRINDEYDSTNNRWYGALKINNVQRIGGPPYAIQWSTACVDPIVGTWEAGWLEPILGVDYAAFVDITDKKAAHRDEIRRLNNTGGSGYRYTMDFVWGTGTSMCDWPSNPPPPPDYRIQGRVFVDKNRDGNRDSGEPNFTGAVIEKRGDNYETDKTGSNGFNFYNLPARNDYRVTLNVPNGYVATNDRDRTSIDLPPTREFSNNREINFGIAPDRGEISGIVYVDEWNGNTAPNGKIDGNDTRRRNDDVRRNPNGANELSKTNSDGRYRFTDLDPGSDHNIRLDGVNACRFTIQGDNPKTNVNAPSGGNNDVNFRLTRRYFNISGNIYRYVAGACTPTINTNCQAYGRSVKLTVLGEGRNDDSRPGDTPDYRITRVEDQDGAYTVRLSGLRTGESIVGGNDKDVTVSCANERQDWYIQPAGATEFAISGSVYVNTNGTAGLQTGGTNPDERYTGGGTIQIRTGNNSASTGRTGALSDSGTYIVNDNPQNTNYRVRLQAASLADGYTINGTVGNDLLVNMDTEDVSRVNFLLNPPPGSTYSIQGGVYIDSTNPEGKKTDGEPYVARSGTESITITGRDAGNSSINRTITNFTPSANGFSSTGLPAGQYWIDFSGPNGRGAGWRVTYPSGTSPFRIPVTLGPSCNDDATDDIGVALCTASGSVTNVDFGIKEQNDDSWYQSIGGDVRIDADGYRNIIPDGTTPVCGSSTYPYLSSNSVSGNLTSGIAFTGNNPNLSNSGR